MKCPSADSWDLAAMKAADVPDMAAWLGHAAECPACAERLADASRAHFDRIRTYEVFDCNHDQLRDQMMAALPAQDPMPTHRGVRARLGGFYVNVNTRTNRRFATILVPAACVALAAMSFLMPGQRSAFAQALERIRNAQTITCRYLAFLNGSETPMQSGTMVLSQEQGLWFEAQTDTTSLGVPNSFTMTVVRQADGPIYVLQPHLNLALKMNVPPGFSGFSNTSGPMSASSPDAFVSSFRKLTGEADRALGRSSLDGREVEGYAVSGRKLGIMPVGTPSEGAEGTEARLYVDATTHAPVKMEVDLEQNMPMFGTMRRRVVIDQIEVDQSADPSLFVPQVPAEFNLVEVTLSLPNEEALVETLRLYREIAGAYPSVLDPAQLSSSVSMSLIASGKVKFDVTNPGSMMKSELLQPSMTVAVGCTFAQQLEMEGRNPEYFGSTVTTLDPDATLMRWTLPDGQVRVIRGDLTLETLPAPK